MTLKTYAAIATGALAMLVTGLLLWAGTQLSAQDVIAISILAYFVGIAGTYEATDWLERRRKRLLAQKIVALIKQEQEKGKEEAS